MNKDDHLRQCAFLWLIAWLPRLILGITFANYPIALSDMLQYDMLARSLKEGRGYRWYMQADLELFRSYLSTMLDLSAVRVPENGLPTTFRAPGYPFFLATLYRFAPFELRFPVARLVQAVVGALMAPLTAALALRMGLGWRAARLAGLSMAFYPILLFYPIGLASENLFMPLVLASLLALTWAAERASLPRMLGAGLTLGMAMLTRSILVLFVILAGVWLWRYGQAGRRGALLLCLAAFGLCLPWAVRNTWVMKRPTFIETSLAYNLFVGYHPEGNGGFVAEVGGLPLAILDDGERDRFCTEAALGYIRADPIEALRRLVRRAAFFVGMEDRELVFFYGAGFFGYIPRAWLIVIYISLIVPWIGTATFAILGLLLSPNRAAIWLALALIGGYALPHLFVIAEPRFHLALVPVLMPFATYGWLERQRVAALLWGLDEKRSGKTWLAYLSLGTLLVLWIWGFAMHWGRLLLHFGPDGHRLYLPY